MSTALFEKLHPRAGDGTFTEKFQSPGSTVLTDPACAMAVDLEWVAEIRSDLQAALEPRTRAAAHVRSAWTPEVREAVRIREEKRNEALEALDIYGGPDLAVAAVGSAVADRAEILAGITVTEIRSGWGQRLEDAEAEYEAASEAYKEDSSKDSGRYERYANARAALIYAKSGTDDTTKQDMRRLADGYLASLKEIRPMGGTLRLHPKSDKRAAAILQEAAQLFPTDFINASNAGGFQLLAKDTAGRAHYAHGHALKTKKTIESYTTQAQLPGAPRPQDSVRRKWEEVEDEAAAAQGIRRFRSPEYEVQWEWDRFTPTKDGSPRGTGWERWEDPETKEVAWRRQYTYSRTVDAEYVGKLLVDRDPFSYMEGRSGAVSTALHEFSHRSEATVKRGHSLDSAPAVGIAALEAAFLERRTTFEDENGDMVRQPKEKIRPGEKIMSKEYCRPDHFPERYMGKEYDGTYFELMSVGMEAVFAGQYGGFIGVGRHTSDRESRDFILGTLAVAHHSDRPAQA